MRVTRLKINQYLLIQNLELKFGRPGRLDTGEYALDFLVGLNGSGKSTILRALAHIFATLESGQTTGFDYELDYTLQQEDKDIRVEVSQTHDETGRPKITMAVQVPDGEQMVWFEGVDTNYLPRNVVVFTTGSEEPWEELIGRIQDDFESPTAPDDLLGDPLERAIRELPGHVNNHARPLEDAIASPFLLLRASRLPAIMLCGLLANLATSPEPEQRPLTDVLASLGVQYIRGFSLHFRLHRRLSSYNTFDRLKPLATRHIQQGSDHLLVFDLSENERSLSTKIVERFGNALALFQALDDYYTPSQAGEPTLQQVNIIFERPQLERDDIGDGTQTTRLLLLDWFSDGEQSFLGRMALLAMLNIENSLILLDEPEVHFNDYWKREVVNLLDVVMRERSNHLLISSHWSILLSDVTDAQVITLVRNQEGIAEIVSVEAPTFGADPSNIMIHIFDTGSAIGSFSAKYLADAFERKDPEELRDLLDKVGMGYWRFRIRDLLEGQNAA